MRSRPRAMLCDALVRHERGSCCVCLDVSMFRGLRDDRPRGPRGSAVGPSVRAIVAWIHSCTRCDHDGYQVPPLWIDVRFDFIASARSPNLTAVNAIILHSCIKRHVERLATMAGAVFNRRIE